MGNVVLTIEPQPKHAVAHCG